MWIVLEYYRKLDPAHRLYRRFGYDKIWGGKGFPKLGFASQFGGGRHHFNQQCLPPFAGCYGPQAESAGDCRAGIKAGLLATH